MSIYLVDFENVTSEGLGGVGQLTSEDRVILFYSHKANRISMNVHREICNSEAVIEYKEVKVGGKNALDFQLSTYLGYLVGQGEDTTYFIISKDKGYSHLSAFWKGALGTDKAPVKVENVASIKVAKEIDNQFVQQQAALAAVEVEAPVMETVVEEAAIEPEEMAVELAEIEEAETVEAVEEMAVEIEPETEAVEAVVEPEVAPQGQEAGVAEVVVEEVPTRKLKLVEKAPRYKQNETRQTRTNANKEQTKPAVDAEQAALERAEKIRLKDEKIKALKAKAEKKSKQKNEQKVAKAPIKEVKKPEVELQELLQTEIETGQMEHVLSCLKSAKNRQDFYCKIVKVLGQEQGSGVYRKVRRLVGKRQVV